MLENIFHLKQGPPTVVKLRAASWVKINAKGN